MEQNMSGIRKFWRIICGPVIYFGISLIVSFAGVMIIMAVNMGDLFNASSAEMYGTLMEEVSRANYLLMLIAIAISVPLLLLFMRSDKRMDLRAGIVVRANHSPVSYIILIPTGICACLGLSSLVEMMGAYDVSSSYSQVEAMLYQGNLFMEILVAGLLAPVVEELAFRGLTHPRMRKSFGPLATIVLTALMFGIYHGNLVQGIYAFLFGLLLSFARERYQNIYAPIILHASGNLFAVIATETSAFDFLNQTGTKGYLVTGITLVLALAGFYYILNFVHSETVRIEPHTF